MTVFCTLALGKAMKSSKTRMTFVTKVIFFLSFFFCGVREKSLEWNFLVLIVLLIYIFLFVPSGDRPEGISLSISDSSLLAMFTWHHKDGLFWVDESQIDAFLFLFSSFVFFNIELFFFFFTNNVYCSII